MPSLQQQMPSPGIPLNLPVVSEKKNNRKKKRKGNSSATTGTLSGKELEVRMVYSEVVLSKSSCASLNIDIIWKRLNFLQFDLH